jgi:DNA-directed RNA polymerase specialized sigma24 family protein
VTTLSDKAFRNLTKKQREVWELVMRDFQTQAKASATLGISRDALKDRLNKAKKRYTKFIEEYL